MVATSASAGEIGSSAAQPPAWNRERLEELARQLPDSPLRSAILATVSEREPTVREALAWVALLQAGHPPHLQVRREDSGLLEYPEISGPIKMEA
jgi:hypothetical protein